MTTKEQQRLQKQLLDWYGAHGRDLPWRVVGGPADPYRVWLSEIMLQQTTVAAVRPYFEAFTRRWPDLEALAAADLDQVLHAWQGLGYYARARNLHACARMVASEFGGRFPDTEKALRSLPGIGAYTAAAIAAIAFDKRSAPVDGNIARVISRLYQIQTPLPGLTKEAAAVLAPLVPAGRPGDFVQAMMDLGAGVCTPNNPRCGDCPWRGDCAAYGAGTADDLPVRAAKKVKPTRHGVVFWVENADGEILLRRRPDKGLLGGMMEFPSTEWREVGWSLNDAVREAPLTADWRPLAGGVRHTFTHFHLELTVLAGRCPRPGAAEGVWCGPDGFSRQALPSVMKKVARHALARE